MQNQVALVTHHKMSLDEEVREMARLREKCILDENSAIGNAKKAGKKEGLEKAAQKMRNSGISEEQIQMILNS